MTYVCRKKSTLNLMNEDNRDNDVLQTYIQKEETYKNEQNFSVKMQPKKNTNIKTHKFNIKTIKGQVIIYGRKMEWNESFVKKMKKKLIC